MKKHIFSISIVIVLFVVACVKEIRDEDIYKTTEYVGVIVEKSTMQPIQGVQVQVTDGIHVHASAETDLNGKFLIEEINFDEVSRDYYLWLDGSAIDLPSAQEPLKGLGRKTYDYKTLVLYDKTNADLLPTVTTTEISEVKAMSARVGGNVSGDGGHEVTVRGVCYALHQTPRVEEDSVVTAGKDTGSYTCTLARLNKDTTYYVRAYAKNNIGLVYGAQKLFTTKDGKAALTTTAATEITVSSALVGGNITDDGGAEITEKGICWSKTQSPTVSDEHTTDGTGTGSFTHRLQQLEASTTYYYCAYATNACGTYYGTTKSFSTTSGRPTVTTASLSDVTATTAKSGGNVTDNGGFNVTARVICWNTTGNPRINDLHTTNGGGNGNFTSNMTGLTVGTTYYVRAYATNSHGTSYGNEYTLTTNNGLPVVTTGSVSSITASSAVCDGNVTSDGGFPVTAKGICWSTSQYPTISDSHSNNGNGIGPFNGGIANIQANSTYYVRAYATNTVGTEYGQEVSFTTDNGLPTVTTTPVTKNGNNIVSGGNITDDGGFAITARGVCYGQYPNPDLTTTYSHTNNGSDAGYYSSIISGSYTGVLYVRAYATNVNGTSYGNEIVVDMDYLNLPTFSFGGRTYKVLPTPNGTFSPLSGRSYCNALTDYGFTDWRMPSVDELQQMYINRNSIGGFGSNTYWSNSQFYSNTGGGYYAISFNTGDILRGASSSYIRPIRVDH